MTTLPPTAIVWDFDWSLIDANGAIRAMEHLNPERLPDLYNSGESDWIEHSNFLMQGIYERGVSKEAIIECMEQITVSNGCLAAVKYAAEKGIEQVILSDSNTVWIEAFLAHHGIRQYFSEIVANSGKFEGHRLHIIPYHKDSQPPHQCPLCPRNLCKGAALGQMLRDRPANTRLIYIGDGRGDFCPACELQAGDALLCRVGSFAENGLRYQIARSRADSDCLFLPLSISGEEKMKKEEEDDWWRVVTKRGVAYRASKCLDDRTVLGPSHGERVRGIDEGDGWLRCKVPIMKTRHGKRAEVVAEVYEWPFGAELFAVLQQLLGDASLTPQTHA